MKNIDSAQVIDLLPDNLKHVDEIKWICQAIQPEIDEINLAVESILFMYLDRLDDVVLDYLLVEAGIGGSTENSFINTREDKINFIKNYVKLNKLRGTKAGINHAIEMLGIVAEITEWYEVPQELQPYWFKIRINSQNILTDEELRLIRTLINEYKNVRSWYKTEVEHIYLSNIYAGAVLLRRHKIFSKAEYTTSIPSAVYSAVTTKKRLTIRGKFNGSN